MQVVSWITGISILLAPTLAHAYTGPGLGVGALLAIIAVIASAFLALLAIFWYPLKRIFRGRAAAVKESEAVPPENG